MIFPFMDICNQISADLRHSAPCPAAMVFHHISKDIKERILWLRANDYVTDDICEMFGVSLRSIQCWQSNLDHFGSVIPPRNPMQGRPRALDADQCHNLFTMLDESPELFLDEIQDWVAV